MAQKPMRVTRADVAREAGVTETIVSYVINANRYVDNKKCRRSQNSGQGGTHIKCSIWKDTSKNWSTVMQKSSAKKTVRSPLP